MNRFPDFDFSAFQEIFAELNQRQEERESAPRSRTDAVPPASKRAIAKLPEILITKADLDEDETNRECAICLSEQKIGEPATKLPCGHLFCSACLRPWLDKSCSCPVCRFELETDDPHYEPIRKDKMRNHKLRFRSGDLLGMSVSALRSLTQSLGISTAGCFEKSDIIDRITNSSRVVVIPTAASALTYSNSELLAMTIVQLKNLMNRCGVRCQDGILEKHDLIRALATSGRITVVADQNSNSPQTEEISRSTLERMKVSELKGLLHRFGLRNDFCEKSEIVDAILQAKK